MQQILHRYNCVLILMAVILAIGRAEAIDLQSWDQVIDKSKRFEVLPQFNNEAVLDLETQIVWEQQPVPEQPFTSTQDWADAVSVCYSKYVGGRYGWRLPTVEELASLLNPEALYPGPALPSEHPFSNVQGKFYWSATTSAKDPSKAMGVHFTLRVVGSFDKIDGASADAQVWCVRGGHGRDGGY